jgi:folate-dependent phosphoribosylglycinamide formyltransferase PurN
MHIVILCSLDHFHSPIILREIGLKRKGDNVFIITTPKFYRNQNIIFSIYKLYKKSGLDYILSMVITKISFLFLVFLEKYILKKDFKDRQFFSINETIKYFSFTHYHIDDINRQEAMNLIRNIKANVIVTIFFNQILKKSILDLAPLSINIHPSFLPKYRGVCPVFWVLANNEIGSGTSIHIIREGIDNGPIILREKINIDPQDSYFSLYRKCSILGARLLSQILTLGISQSDKLFLQEQNEKEASYYSNISASSVRQFRKNKRKFFILI